MSAALRTLRKALVGLLDPTLSERVRRLEERLGAVEDDLDCDVDCSLAEVAADTQREVAHLRARMDEWEPGRAADELYRSGS